MTVRLEPMKITSPTLHMTILFSICVFIAIIAMSFVFKVEVVARGQGRIVPITRVQVVQPEFAGRITAINVRNGSDVKSGDILIQFDQTDVVATLATIIAEQQSLQIESARIKAIVGTLDLDPGLADFADRAAELFSVPKNLMDHPYATEQRALLAAEVNDLLASFAQINARQDANRKSEAVTNANVARVQATLDIQAVRLQNTQTLLDQGASSRAAFLDVQQAFTELERARDVYLRELDQKIAERGELDITRRQIIAERRSGLLVRKAEIGSRLARLGEEERSARRRVDATTLMAPVSGTVDKLTAFTIGGIVGAGDELMRIVPSNIEVEIEGTFPNQDIGFLAIGQQTNIRLDAYPSERFGFVKGSVRDIAADSTEISSGQWGYAVRIKPQQSYLTVGNDRFTLQPGMTATIDVTTDNRRIISYFFAPIVRTIQDAIGER